MKRYIKISAYIICMTMLMGITSMALEGGAESGEFIEGETDPAGGEENDYETIVETIGETQTENGEIVDSVQGSINGDSSLILPEAENNLKVIAIQVPKNLNFVMDPYNLCEKGVIWSKEYVFRNNGETPICLSLSNIKCNVKDGIIAVGAETEAEEVLNSSERMVKLQILLENGEVLDITEEDSVYEMILAPEEKMSVSIGGWLSAQPQTSWQSGDISIGLMYDVQIAE